MGEGDRLGTLQIDDFAAHVGERFVVMEEAAEVPLELAEAVRLPSHGPDLRSPFALHFRGPREPLLPQRIYSFRHAEMGTLDIFIVPTGQDASGTLYEAIFN